MPQLEVRRVRRATWVNQYIYRERGVPPFEVTYCPARGWDASDNVFGEELATPDWITKVPWPRLELTEIHACHLKALHAVRRALRLLQGSDVCRNLVPAPEPTTQEVMELDTAIRDAHLARLNEWL